MPQTDSIRLDWPALWKAQALVLFYGGVLAGFPKNYFGHTTNLHLTTPCLEL